MECRRTVLSVALQNMCVLSAASGLLVRPARPNVLYMVADDLRIELPAYGASHVYAPALTQLVRPLPPSCFTVSLTGFSCYHGRCGVHRRALFHTCSCAVEGCRRISLTPIMIARRRKSLCCSMQHTATNR